MDTSCSSERGGQDAEESPAVPRGVPVTDIHRIGETPVGLWVDAADLEVLRCSPKGCPEILDELQLSRLSRSRGK